ncbi:M23 family metallopeptidase [Gordonia sp. X0973]|uniref:M23 family metallopeptidase n=1 Tax=Gordonia sp. X0973 TaxID=2742602 RepID=UPI0026574936|nr:M23 family metallopeptidase [Gordonia sp. X0973]
MVEHAGRRFVAPLDASAVVAARTSTTAPANDFETDDFDAFVFDGDGWTNSTTSWNATVSRARSLDADAATSSEITQDIAIPESEFRREGRSTASVVESPAVEPEADEDTAPAVRRAARKPGKSGHHRIAAPPTSLKGGRAALVALAAGAAVAAVAQAASSSTSSTTATTADGAPDLGPGVVAGTTDSDMSAFTRGLDQGKNLAAAEAARENLKRRPLFTSPIPLGTYTFTSCFCSRWGTFHGGIDMAAPLGTPIHAATDGTVIAAGPASGYGNWIQVRADDGTVTMYGHMSSSGVLVQKGQHVTAGDVIALVGNEGFSFGPHVHFEVWKDGRTKIDPMPWLAQHGVRMSNYTG